MDYTEFPDEFYEVDEFGEEAVIDNQNASQQQPPQQLGGDLDNLGLQFKPNENVPPSDTRDFTTKVLNTLGITDPQKIKFEDTTGAVVERPWDALTEQEQINIILGNHLSSEENDLSSDEIDLINAIRNSGGSVEDYMQAYLQANAPEPQQTQPTYKVDELSDDEVYALDLLEKVGSDNITDEELDAAIAAAKQNADLYKKTVDGLRLEYIRLQQDREAQQVNELQARQQAQYEQFAKSINNSINNMTSFIGQDLELSQEDKEELAGFMLELDDNGISAFGKAMQDPRYFTKAAFWLLNEDKITEELTKQMQETYKRGYEQAKKDLGKNNTSKLVFKPKQQTPDKFIDDEYGW